MLVLFFWDNTTLTHFHLKNVNLVSSICFFPRNCDTIDQENMLDLLWSLWPSLHAYGRKATQFTDVLSYFTMQYIRDSSHDPARVRFYDLIFSLV